MYTGQVQYLQSWQPSMRARAVHLRNRAYMGYCRDACCLLTLLFIFLLFFWFLSFNPARYPTVGRYNSSGRYYSYTPFELNTGKIKVIMIAMALLSMAVALAYIQCLKINTKCMVYFSIFTSTLLLFGLSLMFFTMRAALIGIILIILFVVYLLGVYLYFKRHYRSAVIMIRLTAHFISTSASVLMVPVLVGLVAMGLAVMSVVEVVRTNSMHIDGSVMFVRSFYGVCFFIFFNCLIYYVMVYLIANAVADWYYMRGEKCFSGVGRMFAYHLGTITFASLLIPFVKVIQLMLKCCIGDPGQGGCRACCRPCIDCCVGALQGLVYTLNSYSIGLCAQTGQNFVDGAATAGVIIMKNFSLFNALQSVSTFIFLSGMLLSAGIPTIISIILANAYQLDKLTVGVGIMVLIVSCVMSGVTLCTFTESLVILYLFHCMEKQLNVFGAGQPIQHQLVTLSRQQILTDDLEGYQPYVLLNAAFPTFGLEDIDETPEDEYVEQVQHQPVEAVYEQPQVIYHQVIEQPQVIYHQILQPQPFDYPNPYSPAPPAPRPFGNQNIGLSFEPQQPTVASRLRSTQNNTGSPLIGPVIVNSQHPIHSGHLAGTLSMHRSGAHLQLPNLQHLYQLQASYKGLNYPHF